MNIQLKNGLGRYGDSVPFPIGNLSLVINGIPQTSGDFRFIGFSNGKKCVESSITPTFNKVTVPAEKLEAGRFSCYVSHYMKGVEIKRYLVEDLIVTDLNASLTADPEIARMQREIDSLNDLTAQLSEELKRISAAAETTASAHIALDKRLSVLEKNNDILDN